MNFTIGEKLLFELLEALLALYLDPCLWSREECSVKGRGSWVRAVVEEYPFEEMMKLFNDMSRVADRRRGLLMDGVIPTDLYGLDLAEETVWEVVFKALLFDESIELSVAIRDMELGVMSVEPVDGLLKGKSSIEASRSWVAEGMLFCSACIAL